MHVCGCMHLCGCVYAFTCVCVLQLMVRNSDDALFIVPLQVPMPSTWIDE